MKIIMCYGDSNTWGADPISGERHAFEKRWTSILQSELGKEYLVINEGLCGRTTVHNDPYEDYKNGKEYIIPCIETHEPDVITLLLGTNDLKSRFSLSPYDIARGAGKLIEMINLNYLKLGKKIPKIILISPPEIYETGYFSDMFSGGASKSKYLSRFYKQFADEYNCYFIEAGKYISPSKTEGIHWESSQHEILGKLIADKIKTISKNI